MVTHCRQFSFWTGTPAHLQLRILLSQPHRHWDYQHALPFPAKNEIIFKTEKLVEAKWPE